MKKKGNEVMINLDDKDHFQNLERAEPSRGAPDAQRKAFEKWATSKDMSVLRYGGTQFTLDYLDGATDRAWEVWQASAAAALERAAELCDVSAAAIGQKAVPARHEAAQLAAEIRALKGRE